MLTLSGYSFLIAGLVSSTIALATFFISPRISKLVDERGQSKVVPVAAAITMVGLAIMLAVVGSHGPEWTLFIGAVLMGFIPNPQALTRARWTYLIRTGRLGDAAPDLRTMFSYEGRARRHRIHVQPVHLHRARLVHRAHRGLAGGRRLVHRGRDRLDAFAHHRARARLGVGGGAAAKGKSKSVIRTSSVVRVLFVLMLFVGAFYGVFDTARWRLPKSSATPTSPASCSSWRRASPCCAGSCSACSTCAYPSICSSWAVRCSSDAPTAPWRSSTRRSTCSSSPRWRRFLRAVPHRGQRHLRALGLGR